MIELRHVGFSWPGEAPLLKDVSFAIRPGEKLILLGANGCGKSTLLKLLNGLIEPDCGDYLWRGEPLTRARLRAPGHAREFRRACALLFQHPEAMLFNPTVREEIAYGPRQLALADVDARVGHWAQQLALESLLDKAPFLLSGGQKQKLALACLLALDPEVLLLDEPSASLDPATVGYLIDLLLHAGKTLVVATHNLSLAAELGERCIVLGRDGGVLFDGPIAAALADMPLLERAGLAHRHAHRHGHQHAAVEHAHVHVHDWQ
ncbi:energy-coupling factor ABC transporter ATP-binding protein [Rhodocyclus tenuis]|uniref:energy-coupling factor ABC transporter ATP-binding protein n=1 Tax=Rhodocyclus tenuis TaxID=1066 RepID=UPI001908C53D|nr:ABC transporter ATP-binding protein [Rhodocyclus tenuis]MBK1680141.1 ABC transporter [Rhodocyclus tenuis]